MYIQHGKYSPDCNKHPSPRQNLITKKIETAFNKACDLQLQHSHTFLNLEAGLQGKKTKKKIQA